MKLIQHLLERLLNWLTNGRLDELANVRQSLDGCRLALHEAQINESHARAQLMQLRVENSDWPVSAGK